MSKEKSGKTFVKRLAPLLVAAGMAFAILPMLTVQVYGTVDTLHLLYEYEYVYVRGHNDNLTYGNFKVERDGDGKPFYRCGEENVYVDEDSVRKEVRTKDLTGGDCDYLKGDEFEDGFCYYKQEIIGWSTEPGGEIVLKNYQRIGGLNNGATLYPVWKQTPNITYHNTFTGEVLESRGCSKEEVVYETPEDAFSTINSPDYSPEYKEEAVHGDLFTAPYRFFSGWAESEDGAKNGVIEYREGDIITHSDHMDLYTVWGQSRVSDIPPAEVYNTNNAEHFIFGGKRWRKLGASDDKVLLIYDEMMSLGYITPEFPDLGSIYRHIIDWCITGWYEGFSSAEKAAVCGTDKDDGKTPPLNQAKLFLLSRDEAMTYFSGNKDRQGQGQSTNWWFLRDVLDLGVNSDSGLVFSFVVDDGSYYELPEIINGHYYYENYGINWTAGERPAFVLDRSRVLFTSPSGQSNRPYAPATDGSSFGILNNPYEHSDQDQKLILLDETYKDFAAHVNHSNRAYVNPGETVEVSYVNAATGTENISAMLCDNHGDVIGYASMKPEASSGTWELKLPQNLDLAHKDYTLKVFNEQQNGVGCNDYASPFSIITLTKYAFTYAANGATITANCVDTDSACHLADHCVRLTIAAPKRTTYGGAGSAEATLDGLADFNSATGRNVAESDIRYVGRDGTAYAESTSAPTDAGKYTAKITVEGKTASVDYEIAKADPSYTIEPKTVDTDITAADSDKTLIVPGKAEGGELLYAMSYCGNPDASANLQEPGKDSASWSTAAPTGDAAGYYIIWYYIRGDANHHDSETSWLIKSIQPDDSGAAVFDIKKLPVINRGLKYTGGKQNLMETPEDATLPEGAAFVYYCREGSDVLPENAVFTEELPAGTNAGTYDVWLTVAGADNFNFPNIGPVSVRIDKADSLPLGEVTIEQPCTSTAVKASVAGLMPEDAGALTYTAGEAAVSGGATVSDFAVDHDGNVTAKISGGKGGDTITLPVTIGSTNYKDSSVAVIVTLTGTQPAAKTSIKNAKVSGIKAKTWTGKALKQSPDVKLSGKTLKSGTNYTVAYKNNKNVGKATLTIKGTGSYTGTITKTFKINPKGTSIAKLTKDRKAVAVKWKKQAKKMSKSRITGYQIQLATNKKFTKNKKTVTVKGYKKTSKKVTKLKGGKKYYVKIRTYKTIKGKKYYSKWSKVKTIKTKK